MKEMKMAENEVQEVETKAERKIKPNFSVNEISVITESVRKNLVYIKTLNYRDKSLLIWCILFKTILLTSAPVNSGRYLPPLLLSTSTWRIIHSQGFKPYFTALLR